MARHKLLYGEHTSSEFGIYISGSGTFNAPERDVQTISVPGRDGDLVIDNGRFKNITVSYPAFIREMFKINVAGARRWLATSAGYRRLEDSYHPEFYRMARFIGPLDFDTRFLNKSGECKLSFDCKPQRFLKQGEFKISIEGETKLYNPTGMEALPQIRVFGTGAGELVVGNTIMQIKRIEEYLDIDCDTQNAYKMNENCNNYISQVFPVLEEGETGISFSGGIDKIEIIPRWWTL